MTTVISTSVTGFDLARRLLPITGRIARGAGRVYFFYHTYGGNNFACRDLDGEPLIESHTFETLAEADAWAQDDMLGVQ